MNHKEQVHREILRRFPLQGRAPTVEELADVLGHLNVAEVHQAIEELERDDAIFRDKGSGAILAAYPYSSRQTTHSVTFADGSKVWAMCAIDALGIHFMTEQDITINSVSPQSGLPIEIRMEGGRVSHVEPTDVVVWCAPRKNGERHDAVTSCPGTNFYSSVDAHADGKQKTGEKTGQWLSLSDAIKRSIKSFGLHVVALSLVCFLMVLLFNLGSANAQTKPVGLLQMVDELVLAYNNQDAAGYREAFSEKLREAYALETTQKILNSNMKSQGSIVSHNTQLSPDGKRALVFLEMEQGSFDVHLRINEDNQLERLTWFPHKSDPSVNELSGHEQQLVQEKYQPYVDKFVQAIRDASAKTMLSLMAKDEDDDWTLEDCQSFLVQMNSRGLQRVGDLEVLAPSEVLIPIYFESVDMGFYLGFDKENKISGLRISNYAPSDTKGLLYSTLGADTLRTSDLRSFDRLRDAFASDSGKVRFIALLSPT
jgi:DNA-binding transcriptional regulator YhcF (GntR family)